jgi:hypothetical protein
VDASENKPAYYCIVPIQGIKQDGAQAIVTTPWGDIAIPLEKGKGLGLESTVKVVLEKPVTKPNNKVISIEPVTVYTARMNTTEGRKDPPPPKTEGTRRKKRAAGGGDGAAS